MLLLYKEMMKVTKLLMTSNLGRVQAIDSDRLPSFSFKATRSIYSFSLHQSRSSHNFSVSAIDSLFEVFSMCYKSVSSVTKDGSR